jgi:hypothetical protein
VRIPQVKHSRSLSLRDEEQGLGGGAHAERVHARSRAQLAREREPIRALERQDGYKSVLRTERQRRGFAFAPVQAGDRRCGLDEGAGRA